MKNLKKNNFIRKLWGVVLVAIITVSSNMLIPIEKPIVITVEAAENTIETENLLVDSIYYTAFGDSIAAGFGLPGYEAGILHSAKTSYRERVAEKLEAQYPNDTILTDSLAIDGLNSTQLLEYLTNPESEQYEKFRKAIQKSDMITLSIGSNDILGLFLEEVAKEVGCSLGELATMLSSVIEGGDLRTLVSLLQSAKKLNKTLAGLPEDMEDQQAIALISEGAITGKLEFNTACDQFAENFKRILEEFYSLSTHVKIYVTNIYNPYKGVVLINPINNQCILDMGNLAEFYINKLNQAFTETTVEYQLIDVKTAFDSLEKVPVNVNIAGMEAESLFENFNLDPHPTIEGHEIIASLIGEELTGDIINSRKLLPIGNTDFIAGNFKCTLISFDGINGEVMIQKAKKPKKKIVIPDTIISEGQRIPVTAILAKAWKKDKKITSLVIGKNIKTIGKQAFYQCKNLKNITVKSEIITKLGAKAWKKIRKDAVFKFPKKCKKKYKQLF